MNILYLIQNNLKIKKTPSFLYPSELTLIPPETNGRELESFTSVLVSEPQDKLYSNRVIDPTHKECTEDKCLYFGAPNKMRIPIFDTDEIIEIRNL